MEHLLCPACGDDLSISIRDELVTRMAHGQAVVAAKSLSERSAHDPEALTEFFVSLETQESNRAVPILAFSYLDENLRQAMVESMQPMSNSRESDLFGPVGPLGSASARISLSEAMGWLTSATAEDLHRLRRIRNHFAHNPEARFGDDVVVGHIRDHPQAEIVSAMMGDNDPDEMYMDRVGRCSIQRSTSVHR